MRTEIFGVNLRNKLFLIVIHRFSLAKAGMNAVQCAPLKIAQRVSGLHWPWRNDINKRRRQS
jgi:hypothetical protein